MASRWSPLARCGAACGVSLRPSEPFGLLGYSFCHSRESGNPGAPVCIPLSFTQCDKPTGGFAFNVCSRRAQIVNLQSIVRCSIFKRDLSRAIKRQGWERLCGVGEGLGLPPAAGARNARDHGAGNWQTALARAAFERTARRLPRDCAAVRTTVKQRGLQEREQPGALKNHPKCCFQYFWSG